MHIIKKNKIQLRIGAPVPLFDRLVDDKPHVKAESVVQNYLDEEGLRESIIQELQNILDSRVAAEVDEVEKDQDYIFCLPEHFGLRDFSTLTAQSDRGLRTIAAHVREAIIRFEPRLLNPKVQITSARKDNTDIDVAISGDVILGQEVIPMVFPITLHNLFRRPNS